MILQDERNIGKQLFFCNVRTFILHHIFHQKVLFRYAFVSSIHQTLFRNIITIVYVLTIMASIVKTMKGQQYVKLKLLTNLVPIAMSLLCHSITQCQAQTNSLGSCIRLIFAVIYPLQQIYVRGRLDECHQIIMNIYARTATLLKLERSNFRNPLLAVWSDLNILLMKFNRLR